MIRFEKLIFVFLKKIFSHGWKHINSKYIQIWVPWIDDLFTLLQFHIIFENGNTHSYVVTTHTYVWEQTIFIFFPSSKEGKKSFIHVPIGYYMIGYWRQKIILNIPPFWIMDEELPEQKNLKHEMKINKNNYETFFVLNSFHVLNFSALKVLHPP